MLINKIKALKIVKKNGLDLKKLPKHFRKDREIVLNAVKNDGFAIADAHRKLLDDKEIAIAAIKNNRHTFLLLNKKLTMAFHRLAIMGISDSGNQPMKHPKDNSLTLICNGEIYNYKKLAHDYGFKLTTGSDSEIILHLFKEIGIEGTVKALDGVFMFVL